MSFKLVRTCSGITRVYALADVSRIMVRGAMHEKPITYHPRKWDFSPKLGQQGSGAPSLLCAPGTSEIVRDV